MLRMIATTPPMHLLVYACMSCVYYTAARPRAPTQGQQRGGRTFEEGVVDLPPAVQAHILQEKFLPPAGESSRTIWDQ